LRRAKRLAAAPLGGITRSVFTAGNRYVIGLGANLGDRAATFESALSAMARLGYIQAVSRLFETAPVGGPVQPDYYNAAASLQTSFSPRELLKRLLGIEQKHGRIRNERWGPRLLDLDILWLEGIAVDEPGLRVPHARLEERNFALIPLLDIAPGAQDPISGKAYRDQPIARDMAGMRVCGLPSPLANFAAGERPPLSLWTPCR